VITTPLLTINITSGTGYNLTLGAYDPDYAQCLQIYLLTASNLGVPSIGTTYSSSSISNSSAPFCTVVGVGADSTMMANSSSSSNGTSLPPAASSSLGSTNNVCPYPHVSTNAVAYFSFQAFVPGSELLTFQVSDGYSLSTAPGQIMINVLAPPPPPAVVVNQTVATIGNPVVSVVTQIPTQVGSSQDQNGGLGTPAIAGIAVGAAAFVTIVGVLGSYLAYSRIIASKLEDQVRWFLLSGFG
jgi:hypothetical protein